MSNYDRAQKLSDVEPSEWTQPVLIKANVLATLALADELRAAREPAKGSEAFRYVYALTRRTDGDRWADTVSIYLVEETARKEAEALNKAALQMNSAVVWAVSTHILKEG